jgi:PAS domain S-box-containing protein
MGDIEKNKEELIRELEDLRQRLSVLERQESQRRQSEMLIKEVEERYNMLFNLSKDAYYISDLKGTFLDGNDSAERIIGYKKEEVIGRSYLKLNLIPLKQITKATELLTKNALGKPTGPDEFIIRHKDGRLIPVEISTTPMRIRGETLVLGIVHSVEDVKRLEQNLEDSEEHLRVIYENVSDAIIRLDSTGTILTANPQLEKIFGYKLENVIGHNFASLGLFNPTDLPKIMGLFGRVLKGEKTSLILVHPKHRDGQKIATEASVNVLRKGGDIDSIFVIARDVSGRREMPEQE